MEDNYSQWEHHEWRQQQDLAKRPVCCYCQEHIQDEELFDIEGELYCKQCLVNNFRKNTEDYIE